MNNFKISKKVFKFYDLFLIIILVFFDYITKFLFIFFLETKKINIIGDYLFLEVYKNTGIAFSIELPFLKIITFIIILGIIFYYIKYERYKNSKYLNLAFVLIISGALGNARERLLLGEVTDFIGIKYFSVFNFADIYINLGIIIYLSIIILKKDKVGLY